MSQWLWVFPAGGLFLTAAGIYGGWVIGRFKGESAHDMAKAAQERADQAMAAANKAVTDARQDLANYRTEVVAKFATIEMLTKSEDRMADAFNRFTDRLDRLLEQRSTETPRPPRGRSPKTPG